MSSWTRSYKMVRPGLGVYRELPILRGPYPIDRAPTTRLSIVLFWVYWLLALLKHRACRLPTIVSRKPI